MQLATADETSAPSVLSPRAPVQAEAPRRGGRGLGVGGAVCLALCLLALGLRLFGLGDLPLWVDEAYTWANAHEPLSRLLGARLNAHPPGYFLMERYWIGVVGETEFALRLSSALTSVLAVAGLWLLGSRLGRRWAGLVAASLVTVAPLAVGYGREARMYGLLVAEVALLLVLADRVAARPTTARWAAYAALALATELMHYTGLAAVVAGAIWTLPTVRRHMSRWGLVHAALLLVLAVWGLNFWANRDAWLPLVWLPWASRVSLDQQTIDWATDLAGVTLGQISIGRAIAPDNLTRLILTVPLFLLGAVGVARIGRQRVRPALALLLLGVGPLVAIILLEPIRPMWHVRFTIVGLPAIFLLAALGVDALGRRVPVAAALVAVVVGPQLFGLLQTPPDPREDWRTIARDMRPRLAAGDVVLGGIEAMTRYYLGATSLVKQRPVPIGRPIGATIDELNQSVGNARVVWLVPADDPLLDPSDLVAATLERYAVNKALYTVAGISVARLELRPRERFVSSPSMTPVTAVYGGAIRLLGFAAERRHLGAEWSVQLSLDARIERRLDRDYKLFAHLLDAGGQTVTQRDVVPVDGARRATSQMEVGAPVRIEVAIHGSAEQIQAGRSVGIGFYDEASGTRLPLEPPAPEHRLVVGVGDPP